MANWELAYRDGSRTHGLFEAARSFEPDVIVIRFVENCPAKDPSPDLFKKELASLIRYLDKEQKARLIVTTGFWKHPLDEALRDYAKEAGAPLVELGDLGEDTTMKAIGLFEHGGVANHPGDLGMQCIADRILEALLPLLSEDK